MVVLLLLLKLLKLLLLLLLLLLLGRRRRGGGGGGTGTTTSTSYLSAYQALEPKTALLPVLVQVQVLVFCCGQPQCCSYTFASQPSERPRSGL